MEERDIPPTQLADSRPQLDAPLRVSIPVNAPARTAKVSHDQYIRSNAFSPAALSMTKQILPSLVGVGGKKLGGGGKTGPGSSGGAAGSTGGDADNAAIKTAISDFTLLAFSSKRSGKKDVEATAYVSLGVIYDNQGDLMRAIENYKQYAGICEEIGDIVGHACACNCLGVDYMMLSCPPSDAGCVNGFRHTTESQAYLQEAIKYHTKHMELGPDNGGRFVANTNLGLCLGMQGDAGRSAKHHQDSLRIAIKMQTLYGQAIAVGNLGMLALVRSDWTTARTCFEQHLQLVQALLDPDAEINAWKLLAKLDAQEGRHAQSLESLDQARRVATREGHMNELRRINCLVGLSKAGLEFEGFVEELAARALQGETV